MIFKWEHLYTVSTCLELWWKEAVCHESLRDTRTLSFLKAMVARCQDLEKHQVIFVEVDVQDVQDATYQEDSDKLTEESTVTFEGERAERAEGAEGDEDIKSPSETALELDALDALDAPDAVGVPPKPTETEASKASVASAAEAASEAWPMPPTAPTVKPTEVKGTKDTVAKASSDPTDLKETKKDGKYAKEKKGGKEEKKDTWTKVQVSRPDFLKAWFRSLEFSASITKPELARSP